MSTSTDMTEKLYLGLLYTNLDDKSTTINYLKSMSAKKWVVLQSLSLCIKSKIRF